MSKPVCSLSYSSMLTEDYIHTDSILASAKATAPLATFLNGQGQSEALVVFDDGELCHLQREPLSNSGWNFNGIGYTIGSIMAANRGSVWMMDEDQAIWMTNTGHWNELGTQPGGDQSISAGLDGTVYRVARMEDHSIHLSTFDLSSGSFLDQGVVPIISAPLGNPDSLWALSGQKLYTNTNGSWREVNAQFASEDVPYRLSVGSDISVWILCRNGTIYSYDPANGTLRKLDGVPFNVQYLAAADAKTLYIVNSDAQWNNQLQTNETGTWKEIAYPASRIAEISIGNDGVLWARDQDGRLWILVEGKWVRQIMPTDQSGFTGGHKVREVVTGTHYNGQIEYAFFTMENSSKPGVYDLYWSRLFTSEGPYGGNWSQPGLLFSGCSNIATVNDPSDTSLHQLLVYGVSDKGNFVLVQPAGDKWTATEFPMKTSLAGVKPAFLYDGTWLTYAIIQDKDKKGKLFVGSGSLKSPATTLNAAKTSGTVPAGLRTIVPFETSCYGMTGTLLAAIDDADQVWTISGASGTVYFEQLTGTLGAVESVVGMLVPKDGARIYASDKEKNLLWINRQTAAIKNKPPQPDTIVWSDWHPLGNECKVLATGCTIPPPDAPYTPPVDLFCLDLGYEVNVLSEDPVTGVLTDLVMMKPDGTNNPAEYVTRYVSEITVVDENLSPQPGLEVAITADEPIGIWVGNNLYSVSSKTSAMLTTNEYGKITFAFFATDLHTPTFSFRGDGLEDAPFFSPASSLHAYLGGDPNALPNRPTFNGDALQKAQMQTAPSWTKKPEDFVGNANKDKAPAVADNIHSVFGMDVSASGDSGEWSVAATQPAGVSSSSFWHDLCRFPHDIEHAIRNDVMKVEHAFVDVGKQVVQFTMRIGKDLTQLLELAIKTIKDVISAVKSFFRYIERGIEDVLDWLKALFNWEDILNTKKVLEASINGLLIKMADNFDSKSPRYVGIFVDEYFEELREKILSGFEKAKKGFLGGDSFNGGAQTNPYPGKADPMGNDPMSPTNTSKAQNTNGAQTNFVKTHVSNYSDQGGSFPATGSDVSANSIIQSLYDAFENSVRNTDFRERQQEAMSKLNGAFSSPKSFFNVVMYEVITALEDLIDVLLKVVQGVLDALIAIVGQALTAFKDLLNAPIEIPVVSYIYKQIAKHPLTMIDLLCLIIATPATLLYKLTFGLPHATAPFTADQAEKIAAELSDPATFPWPVFSQQKISPAGGIINGPNEFLASDALIMFIPALAVGAAEFDMVLDFMAYEAIYFNDFVRKFQAAVVKEISVISIFFSMAAHFYGAPFHLFKSQKDEAERLELILWSSGFSIMLVNIIFTFFGDAKAVARFSEKWGIPLTSLMGVLMIYMAITLDCDLYEQAENKKDVDWFAMVGNLLGPLQPAMCPIIAIGEPQALVYMVFDGVADLAGGALSTLSALRNRGEEGAILALAV
jgi:hypothetical protein